MTAAAATGYCLAKHPFNDLGMVGGPAWTPEGYERAPAYGFAPGMVSAVRRNYIHARSSTLVDEGLYNTCEDACREFYAEYGPVGHALHFKSGDPANPVIWPDGIGDMAQMARLDWDFYLNRYVIAGIGSRANDWHTADVAQSDFCCCTAY